MIVVVILVIASMIVVPLTSSAASIQIRSAANIVAADLEYAKSTAIAKGQRYSVVFDTAAHSYSILNQDGVVIENPIKRGTNYIVNFTADSRLSKVDISEANFDSTSEIKFDYLGSPYNGANNPLNSGVVTLSTGTDTMTINVEPVTGFITISN
jgi:Tfp pilus assembly protein FimT